MRAAVLHAPGEVRVEEIDDPEIIEPTDAVIRLTATCVCGSDLWPYRGVESVDGPVPMGHEYVGVVEEVGDQVRTVKPGQFVVGSFVASDGTCEICRSGYPSSCVHRVFMSQIGTQSERARIPWADGTLVATPVSPTSTWSPACWRLRTSSAPAGSARWPPRPAPAGRSPSWATARSDCWRCWPPGGWAPSGSSP